MNLPLSASSRVRGPLRPNPPVLLTGYPVIDPNPNVQARYEDLRRHGQSHNMAEMLTYRQAPASRTDDDFFRGQGTLDKQVGEDPHYMADITSGYRQATGHNPNPNYVYQAGLAQYPGDPRAFVSGAGDVKRRAEELNVNVEGFVTHKASEPISDPFGVGVPKGMKRQPIATDLKQVIADSIVAKNPDMKGRVSMAALDAKHGNHVKVN